jgi:parvulin-like peptidyl-prolyl isomerase
MAGSSEVKGRGIATMLGRVPLAAGAAVLAAAVIALVVVLVTGGDDKPKIPSGAVAVVGDRPITDSSLRHWETVYSQAAASSSAPKPTAAQTRKGAFALLAGFAWIENEAVRRNVTVTKAQLDTAMSAFFSQYQGTSKAQVLQQMGASEPDLRAQQRVSLLANALQSKVAKTAPAPSAQAISAKYNSEPERWAHPSKRDVRVVVTSSKKNAQAAAAALTSGQSFTTVNKRYSTDSQLTNAGGALKGLKPGSSDPTFERAVFKASLGQLTGPLVTSTGWVVLKVQKITPLPDQTLAQSTKAIRTELTSAAQSKVVNTYLTGMRKYWHDRTHCTDAVKDKTYCA